MAIGPTLRGRSAFCLVVGIAAGCVIALLSSSHLLLAQDLHPADRRYSVRAASLLAPDLQFPVATIAAAQFATPQMALLTPEGAGPFPALVVVHQCSGLNRAVADHAREAVRRGYVVLLIDSLGPRSVRSVCYGPQQGVNFFRGVRDVLQAADHLRKQPKVDKDRIGLVGYSWGGMVGLMAASRSYRAQLELGAPFAATVAYYPGCFRIDPPIGRPYEIFNPDVDRPLLVLMGEADSETPAAECIDRMKRADDGSIVRWHVYPATTHCWDCKHADGLRKIDIRGNDVTYRYDAQVTEDAVERTFDFLKRQLAPR